MTLTYEDGFWRFSARSVRGGDVVHRPEDATLSEGRQKPPAGLPVPPAGRCRSVATMNHIAASVPPCQRTGLAILIAQDHRRLVLAISRVPNFPPVVVAWPAFLDTLIDAAVLVAPTLSIRR